MAIFLDVMPSAIELDNRADKLLAEARRLPHGKRKDAMLRQAAGDRFKTKLMRISESHSRDSDQAVE